MSNVVNETPILDYAGPTSRSALRLAAQSELHVTASPPHRLVVRETLAGQVGAIGALLLAAVALLALSGVEVDMGHKWRRHVQEMAFIGGVMAAEIAIAFLVVNQTWRRTVLLVTPEQVSLTFASPFGKKTRLQWKAEQVAQVAIIDSPATRDPSGAVVPELELRMWSGPPVRLFTGHRQQQLAFLAQTIREIQPPLPDTR